MEIFPVWRDLFFEYQGDVLEYRITIKDGDEIFHGRAVKSPKDRVIRIRLNDCCESFLNSLLGEEAFREAESIDRAYPMDAYGEFALDVIEGDSWETAYEWAFTNDYSYDYKEPQGSYSEPINGHSATGQLLPYSHLVTGDTESVCYDGCDSVFFTITEGVVMEYGWGGGYWRVRWDTNLDSVYYICSDGTTGTSSIGLLGKALPRNYNFFKQQYTVRFYDRQGGTLLGTAVATVDAIPDADPDPIARTMSIISYPSVITEETTAVTVEYSISDREEVLFELYSSTTQGSGYQYYDGYWDYRNAGVNSETFTIPANTDTNPVYYRISLRIVGLNAQYADITQLGKNAGYFTIIPLSNGYIYWGHDGSGTNPDLEYSKDSGQTWYALLENGEPVYGRANEKIWLRGTDIHGSRFSSTMPFDVEGNIFSLIYGDNFAGETTIPDLGDYVLAYIFKGSKVVNAENLILPATSFGPSSGRMYAHMFENCTLLEKAPALPATNLYATCYDHMFAGCTSLVSAPALPATNVPNGCYFDMFYGCTSLVSAPALPATTATTNCYVGMFDGCTSLVNAPDLPATSVGELAYSYMFRGCTSLVSAPVISATTLNRSACKQMFEGCTSLVSAPELNITGISENCCIYMFSGCTSLVNGPSTLPATTLAPSCYVEMFIGCTSLVNAPTLPATTIGALATNCYLSMFQGCTSLMNAPVLPATTIQASGCYKAMFSGCTSLGNVKCLASGFPNPSCTENWMRGVPASGTFTKAAGTTWSSGASGIPTGWTVLEE